MNRPDPSTGRSGWLVGLIALAGGLAAPMSMPAAGSLAPPPARAAAPQAGAVGESLAASLAERGGDPELAEFYAGRGERPLWVDRGRLRPEARQVLSLVADAGADGLRPADYAPQALQAAVRTAASGRPADLVRAEMALTEAVAAYGADLHRARPAAAILYSDPQFPAPALDRRAMLQRLGQARSLKDGLAAVRRMNPLYEGLRAALAEEQARGGPNTALIRANLERARALPEDLGRRYILVDVTAQRLWTYEGGRPVDSMKVVVGKPSEPTPTMAALVRYAVFRPYWNVPPDLVAGSMAPKVLRQGLGYFHAKHLEALSDWTDRAKPIDPAKVNWRAVAAGRQELRVRQLPGPDNRCSPAKESVPRPAIRDARAREADAGVCRGEQRCN